MAAPEDSGPRVSVAEKSVLGATLLLLLYFTTRKGDRGHSPEHDQRKARADVNSIAAAVGDYALDHRGSYPPDLDALIDSDEDGHSYLDLTRAPIAPWGHPYLYQAPSAGSAHFRVYSLGADGELGGEGYDQDLDNRSMEAEDWIRRISLELKDYADLHDGVYPPSLEPLLRPNHLDCASVPLDPWGRPYRYEPPVGGSSSFHVFTLGADGRLGGEGEDRDIANRPLSDGKL